MRLVAWICGIGAVVSVAVAIITIPLPIWIKALLFFVLLFILTGITGSMSTTVARDEGIWDELT